MTHSIDFDSIEARLAVQAATPPIACVLRRDSVHVSTKS